MSPAALALRALGALFAACCLLAGCTPPRLGGNEMCLFNDECPSGQLCAGNRCRAECQTDRDCPSGLHCAGSAQSPKRVCLPLENPGYCALNSECPAGLVCAFDGVCRHECLTDLDCHAFDPRALCQGLPDGGAMLVEGDAGGTYTRGGMCGFP